MGTQADDTLWSLTEKEKQTLRLIVRGHDAKSIARDLNLSVHTINERLRDARRKMAVPSSREAARLLLAAEEAAAPAPNSFADEGLRDDAASTPPDVDTAPNVGAPRAGRRVRILIGVLAMTIILGLLALAAAPQLASPAPSHSATSEAVNPQVVNAARTFLMLVDQGRWDDSYRLTAAAFQHLNTARVWAKASRTVRVPLGAAVSRTFVSQENLPAPPDGYEVVKFRTQFANRAQEATETVSLVRENREWRVAGVTIG